MKPLSTILLLLFICHGLQAQEKICGYATEANKQSPLPDVTIFLYDQYNIALEPDVRTKTDSNGYYEFNNISPNKYSVNAWTLVPFHEDTVIFVVQPGYIKVKSDTTHNPAKLPCYYVNFEFELAISDEEYETTREKIQTEQLESYIRYTENSGTPVDSTLLERLQNIGFSSGAIEKHISVKITSIDSLFHYQPSHYMSSYKQYKARLENE